MSQNNNNGFYKENDRLREIDSQSGQDNSIPAHNNVHEPSEEMPNNEFQQFSDGGQTNNELQQPINSVQESNEFQNGYNSQLNNNFQQPDISVLESSEFQQVTGNGQPSSGFQPLTNNSQQNNEFQQFANNGQQNNEFQNFANSGQPNFQQVGNAQINQQTSQNWDQQQFDTQFVNSDNVPKTKKRFYKNPVFWLILLICILSLVFALKMLGGNTDFDDDGLTRAEEIETYHTNPRKSDTDSDGFTDYVEIDFGTDPNVKAISMSSGTWTVGEDIAPGTYNMMCLEDEKGDVTVNTSTGEEKEVYELGEGIVRDGTTVQVELAEGDVITVENKLSVVYFEIIE